MANNSDFFHGSKVTDVTKKLVVVSLTNAGTIALIGTAPDGPAGMTNVTNPVEGAQFGPSVFDGRTISHALDAIFGQGASQVIVINCFDAGKHLVDVANEAGSVNDSLQASLQHVPTGALTVTATRNGADVPLTLGVDYKYTTGDSKITILARKLNPSGTALKFSYSYFKSSTVTAADIIGGIDPDTGDRTGIALLDLAYSEFGITPKILIAPSYVEQPTVLDALDLQAAKLRARTIVDIPMGITIAGAIDSRNADGNIDNFYTANNRRVGVFPYVLKPDPSNTTSPGVATPYSAYFAGMWSYIIGALGMHYSPSNQPIVGVTKPVTAVSFIIGDKTCDANQLNAAGINTLIGANGSLRAWGNHSLAFPENTDVDEIQTFMAVQLVKDIVDESVQIAALAYQDLPLNLALIDSIVSAVQNFLNSLVKSGALLKGTITFDKAKNTNDKLSAGKLTFDMAILPPPANEDTEFESYIDTSFFSVINS